MPRIDKDLSEETCPDYRGEVYEDERLLLIGDAERPAMTEDEAVEKLEKMWQIKHQRRVTAWNAQVAAEEEVKRQDMQQTPHPHSDEERKDEQLTSENRQEEPQGYANAGRQRISTIPVNRPAQYAIDKLNAQIYIELDYFTLQGCTMAKNNSSLAGADTLDFVNIASMKAATDIWKDHELTWGEVNQAQHTMIKYMTRAEGNIWSKEIIKSLMSFYMQLDGHSIWQEEYGDEVLVIYQARARREWYDMGIHGEGMNLAIINDGLLINIQQKIVTKKAADSV
ncbi:hypothetical protein BDQ17DRAFT_1267133 [Cyathus striatus]|nr:hypothetical protein BDQ17DRAFT_1267133 [Cyathus striatus]